MAMFPIIKDYKEIECIPSDLFEFSFGPAIIGSLVYNVFRQFQPTLKLV